MKATFARGVIEERQMPRLFLIQARPWRLCGLSALLLVAAAAGSALAAVRYVDANSANPTSSAG